MLKEIANEYDISYSDLTPENKGWLRYLAAESVRRILEDVNSPEQEHLRCRALERLNLFQYCLRNNLDPRNYEIVGINHPLHAESIIRKGDVVLPVWSARRNLNPLEMSTEEWGDDARVVVWRTKKEDKVEVIV